MRTCDVLVVGAGPTGLMLAGEIAAAGRSVTVLDRHPAPSALSRAFGVHAATMELLDARGLADGVLAHGRRVDRLRLWRGVGIRLDRLATRFPYVLVTPQVHVDATLEQFARDRGAQVRRGVTVTGLDQDEDGVTVTADGPDGPQQWRAGWAVGADGVRSTVRELLSVPFPGTEVLRSVMLADVRLSRPPGDGIDVNTAPHGFAFVAPFGDGWFRVIAWDRREQADDATPVTAQEIRAALVAAFGDDLGMGAVRWLSRFHCDERQVGQYRHGRVFLAGDAAHVHSPAGGQGMNTGIQDAANLGWKLAAVVGGADPAILDSYQRERHPVGRQVLRSSGGLMRMMTLQPPVLRAMRRLLAPLATRIRPLVAVAGGQLSGLSVRYPRSAGDHRLVGRRAAGVPQVDGPGEILRAGFVLAASPQGQRLLVRPDGYLAWAGQDDGWRAVYRHWIGDEVVDGPTTFGRSAPPVRVP